MVCGISAKNSGKVINKDTEMITMYCNAQEQDVQMAQELCGSPGIQWGALQGDSLLCCDQTSMVPRLQVIFWLSFFASDCSLNRTSLDNLDLLICNMKIDCQMLHKFGNFHRFCC